MTAPAKTEIDGRERLADWAPKGFIDRLLLQLPPPRDPETSKELWPVGKRLHEPGQRAFVCDPYRWQQAAGGIRGGKSDGGATRIFVDMLWRYNNGLRDELWGVLADTYDMAQEEMKALSAMFSAVGIPHTLTTPKGQRWHLTFDHCAQEVHSLTGGDVSKIASRAYRGIVGAEAAQLSPEAIQNAEDRVSERRGWVALEGTFESSKGLFYNQLATQWSNPAARGKFYSLPTWENRVIYPGGRTDPEILSAEKRMSRERFLERFGGVPARRSKLVMKYASSKHNVQYRFPHSQTSYDPESPVYLWSDPGRAHAYAVVAVQFWKGRKDNYSGEQREFAWVIDIVYRWGATVDSIVQECAAKPWAARARLNVMDVAARQKRVEGEAVIEQWPALWYKHTGNNIGVYTQQVPLHPGYDIHELALLNSWPETDANEMFNQDGQMRVLTDPYGPALMFDPGCVAPMFGGEVDGREYAGEYNAHEFAVDREGYSKRPDPIDLHNDAIKAINYGAFWRWGATGLKRMSESFPGATIPWVLS